MQAKISLGFNFRHANYYNENKRTLIKALGIHFIVNVQGEARRFGFVPTLLNIGAGVIIIVLKCIIVIIIIATTLSIIYYLLSTNCMININLKSLISHLDRVSSSLHSHHNLWYCSPVLPQTQTVLQEEKVPGGEIYQKSNFNSTIYFRFRDIKQMKELRMKELRE